MLAHCVNCEEQFDKKDSDFCSDACKEEFKQSANPETLSALEAQPDQLLSVFNNTLVNQQQQQADLAKVVEKQDKETILAEAIDSVLLGMAKERFDK